MKKKLMTCLVCMACLMPINFAETQAPDIYYDNNTSSYGLKDINGNIISTTLYDGIATFNENRAIVQKDGKFGVITNTGKELVSPTYKYISNYRNGYAVVFQGPFAGALNLEGQLVVPLEYEDISFFRNGNALAYKNKKLGILSSDNKVIHPFVWDEANMLDFTQEFDTFVFKQGDTYGVASFSGAILMNPQAKELFHISDQQVAFASNNKIGVMNHDEKILVPAVYDSIYIAGQGYVGKRDNEYVFINMSKGTISTTYDSITEIAKNRYLISKDNLKGIYDASLHKEIVDLSYDDIQLLQNPHDPQDIYYELTKNSSIHEYVTYKGVATLEGELLIPALYYQLGFINADLLAYYDPQKNIGIYNLSTKEDSGLRYDSLKYDSEGAFGVISVKGGQYGLLDEQGALLIQPSADFIYESGNFYIAEKDGKKALFNKKKRKLTPYKYDTVFSFQNIGETEAAIISVNNKWGLLTPQGKYLVTPEFDAINEFVNGYAIVSRDNLYGFINTKGELIIPPEYEDVSSFNNGVAIAKKSGLYGYIQTNGRFIIPAIFDSVKPFNEDDRAVITYKGKQGVINRNGSYFLKPVYKKLIFVENNMIVLQDHATKMYGLIKPNGEEISKFIYDDVGSFFKEKATYVEINGKYALINTKGEVLTQFIFDEMSLFNKGFASIRIGERQGFINTRGEYILE